MALASLVMGVITLMTSIIPFLNFLSLVMGPVGIIMGAMAIRQIKRAEDSQTGSGMALTGLLISVAGTALTILILILMWAFVTGTPTAL